MAIEQLLTVVSPPPHPDEVGTPAEAREVELRLGTALPADYWDFARRYGSGWFIDTYLYVWNPFVFDLL